MHIQYLDKQHQQTIYQITSFPTSPIRLSNNEGEHCKVPKNAHNDFVFSLFFSYESKACITQWTSAKSIFSLNRKANFLRIKKLSNLLPFLSTICISFLSVWRKLWRMFRNSWLYSCSHLTWKQGAFFRPSLRRYRKDALQSNVGTWQILTHKISFYGEAFPV